MRHRDLAKHKQTTDKNAVNILKTRKEKQQANATVQKSTSEPPPQHYAHAVWDDE